MSERLPCVDLETRACRMLLDAWRIWRGEALLPPRAAVDPGSVLPILPMIGILEVSSRHDARFRLAGSGLRDVFGFEASGMNSIDLAPAQKRARRAYRTYMPAVTPCGYLGLSEFAYGEGVVDQFESIGLPLAADTPGGPPFLIFTLESMTGRQWRKRYGSTIDNISNELRFFDIGAGIPPSVDPPPGFLGGG